MIKFIDLFCGMGGLRLSMPVNNTQCVFSSDINVHAQNIYEFNFGERPYGDITKIKTEDIPSHDLLIGGFPCQAFSIAGKKQGFEDTRGTLFFEIARIIAYHKPRVVLLENVKNLIKHDSGKTLSVILNTLTDLGYHVSVKLMNATDFGIPQNRERLAIVANREGTPFSFDEVKKQEACSMKGFLSDKGEEYLGSQEYTLLDKADIKRSPAGLIFSGYRNKPVRKNGLSPGGLKVSRTHRQCNRIYSIEGIHPTLSAQESSGRYFVQDNYGVRKLSIEDCMKLMGYPKEFKLFGSKSAQYERIGNSICVPMFKNIAEQIMCQFF